MVLQAALDLDIDLRQSYVIGDSDMDTKMGKRVGCKAVLISTLGKNSNIQGQTSPDFIAPNLYEAAKWVIINTTAKTV